MELNEALGRISEIREKLSGGDRLKRFRCATTSLTSVAAFWGGFYQLHYRSQYETATTTFTVFWLTIAAVCAAITGIELWWGHRHESARERRLALKMSCEFSFYLFTGLLLTIATHWQSQDLSFLLPLLPVMWAIIFGLGLFGVRRYFSPAMGWAGAYYVLSACFLLVSFGSQGSLLAMPVTFGIGQLMVTTILLMDKLGETDD